ncbi:MAG: hypothetical protein AAGC60_17625 [Acidobacteriota bacterium]
MCQATIDGKTGIQARRHFECCGGRIEQCLCCGTIGVEFGTTFLVFSEQEFFRFARWFKTLRWEDQEVERDKVRIGLEEEGPMMISLARRELSSVSTLFAEGMEWVANSGMLTEPERPSAPPAALSTAFVH